MERDYGDEHDLNRREDECGCSRKDPPSEWCNYHTWAWREEVRDAE